MTTKMTTTNQFLSQTFGEHLTRPLPDYEAPQAPGQFALQGPHLEALLQAEGKSDQLPFLKAHDWQVPHVATSNPSFVENAMYVQFYGPETHPGLTNFRAGLFFMAPGYFYGNHAHEAREVYVRLAGDCTFTLGEAQNYHDSSALVINEPWAPHAMTAGPKGVLLAWIWTGNVGWDSYAYI